MSALRNFFITFLVSLIIFGILGYFIADFATGAIEQGGIRPGPEITIETNAPDPGTEIPDETTKPNTDDPAPPPIAGETFNLLLIGHNYQPDLYSDYAYNESNLREDGFPVPARVAEAEVILLVRADLEKGCYMICPIPSSTRVLDHGLYRTLGSLYGAYGLETLVEKTAFLTGLPIQYYMSFSIDGLTSLIDDHGGILYYVSSPTVYTDPEHEIEIRLAKGSQTLSGTQLLALLRSDENRETESSLIQTAVDFLVSILDRHTSSEKRDGALADYQRCLPYMETNFLDSDFSSQLDLLFSYPDFTHTILTYPGSSLLYDGIKYFEPNVTKAWALLEEYKYTGNHS